MNSIKDDYLDYIKRTIIHDFRKNLEENKLIYLYEDLIPFDDYILNVQFSSFSFSNDKVEPLKFPNRFTHSLTLNLEADCDLGFQQKSTQLILPKRQKFDLVVKCVFNIDNESFRFDFYDQSKIILSEYFELIYQRYKELDIKCLVDADYKIKEKTPIEFLLNITRGKDAKVNDMFVFDNLGRITQDIRYNITKMIVIAPYVTNYLSDPFIQGGKRYFRYFPTIYDKQYFMSAGILFEFCYNYWDQIGDLLAAYFLPEMGEKNIYFKRVIDDFPKEYRKSTNYVWLQKFRNNQFKDLNQTRIRIVHYNSLESDHFQDYIEKFSDEQKLQKLQNEKVEFISYFLNHHQLVLKGFEIVANLINELKLSLSSNYIVQKSTETLKKLEMASFYDKEVYFTEDLAGNEYAHYQLIGNLGGHPNNYEFSSEISFLVISDKILKGLKKGIKPAIIKEIERKLRNKAVQYKELKIIAESDLLKYHSERLKTVNDNSNRKLLKLLGIE